MDNIISLENGGKPITICVECKHFSGGSIWYDQFCDAARLSKARDPVTGKVGYASINDLGTPSFNEEPRRYCRDVNNGNCGLFEEVGG